MCQHDVEGQAERPPKFTPHPFVIELPILCVSPLLIPMGNSKQQPHQFPKSVSVREGAMGKMLVIRVHKPRNHPSLMSKSNPDCSDVPLFIEWEQARCLAVECEFGCLLKLSEKGVQVSFPDDRPLNCIIAQAALYEAGQSRNVILQTGLLLLINPGITQVL